MANVSTELDKLKITIIVMLVIVSKHAFDYATGLRGENSDSGGLYVSQSNAQQ